MMSRWLRAWTVMFIVLVLLASPGQAGEKTDILLVYDRTNYFAQSTNQAVSLKESLEQFPTLVRMVQEQDYSAGLLNQYDWLFYLSLDGGAVNPVLLQDLAQSKKKIFYLGKGLEHYLSIYPDAQITLQGVSSEITEIVYQGKAIPLGTQEEYPVLQSSEGKWYGRISDGKNSWPYILQLDNFWYASYYNADNPLFSSILADVLEENLGKPLPPPLLPDGEAEENKGASRGKRSSFGIGVSYFTLLVGIICLAFVLILAVSRLRSKERIFVKET